MADLNEILARFFSNLTKKRYLIGEAQDNEEKNAVIIFDNNQGLSENKIFEIPVDDQQPGNQEPIPIINYTPEKPKANQIVNLDSSQSSDPDGVITNRVWSISPNTIQLNVSSDKITANFVYPSSIDEVIVTLEVFDNKNESTSTLRIIEKDDTPVEVETRAIPVSTIASAEDTGKKAIFVNDDDFESRWSAKGLGQYIEFTLDGIYKITKIKLTGFHYDKTYFFEIGGKRFECPANRTPDTLIEYDVKDLGIESHKLKFVGQGNSGSEYNSYRTIQIFGIRTGDKPDEPVVCGINQCKDRVTNQCRAIGVNEEKDSEGYCKIKVIDPDPDPNKLTARLIAIGDSDTTSDAEDVFAAAMKVPEVTEYDFVGDGPYSGSGTKWVSMMKKYFNTAELVNKLRISQGNHDHSESESQETEDDIEEWLPKLTNQNDELDWLTAGIVGNVYVISGNSQDERREFRDGAQFKWLQSELEKAKQLRASGVIDWIVYIIHKPFFTLKTSHSPYTGLRFLYHPLFKDAQVDFVLHGHNHNTQLWVPMIPNESDANAEGTPLFEKLSDGTYDFTKPHGPAYIVSGHGGHEWNEIKDGENKNVMFYADSGKFGFTQLDFFGKDAVVKSIDSDGVVLYQYKVTRKGGVIIDPGEKIDAEAELLVFGKPGETIVLKDGGSKGPITNFEWIPQTNDAKAITLQDETSVRFGKKFVATEAMIDKDIKFRLRVFNAKGEFNDDVGGTTVSITKGIPQPGGKVLWDSNIHLKTGQDYTITDNNGSLDPDSKKVWMAASGDPELEVKADGTFYLKADKGHGRVYINACNYNSVMEGEIMFPDDFDVVRNGTLRLRSRHNEGGACSNRFGGFGVTVEVQEQLAETSTEPCHNEHSNVKKESLKKKIEQGKWFKFRYYLCNTEDNKSIHQKLQYDYNDGQGFVTVIDATFDSVEDYMMNEASFKEKSYAWLRMNNEDTGRIAYKNVKISEISSIPNN